MSAYYLLLFQAIYLSFSQKCLPLSMQWKSGQVHKMYLVTAIWFLPQIHRAFGLCKENYLVCIAVASCIALYCICKRSGYEKN
ncbi:hypothetical protein L211DRAFT_370604 [Terfezia boudieri ATCC MYA-4762]|uniref:Uncharacterized protein n=1 Tax=Terfezia boudieri ATCC MYA-4762 TaxID=1051890 RepID=A0A3N4LZB6_9PEZI|nr:hypothetical protein L211DRAFT_370604 [Terfezia boudieri ATCC MYA-4762]